VVGHGGLFDPASHWDGEGMTRTSADAWRSGGSDLDPISCCRSWAFQRRDAPHVLSFASDSTILSTIWVSSGDFVIQGIRAPRPFWIRSRWSTRRTNPYACAQCLAAAARVSGTRRQCAGNNVARGRPRPKPPRGRAGGRWYRERKRHTGSTGRIVEDEFNVTRTRCRDQAKIGHRIQPCANGQRIRAPIA